MTFSIKIRILILGALSVLVSSIFVFLVRPHWDGLSYSWLRFFHILGAILLLGNILTGALWMIASDLQKSPLIFRFSIRVINLTDIIFTVPGALLLLWNGLFLSQQKMEIWQFPWFQLAILLFILLGLVWTCVLVPMQIHFEVLSENLESFLVIFESKKFRQQLTKYFIFGSIAGILSVIILSLMIFKPSF